MTSLIRMATALLCASWSFFAQSETAANGAWHDTAPLVWEAGAQQWISPEAFWQVYAKAQGGLTWGQSRDYPPYEKSVRGICSWFRLLMAFV